MKRIYILAIVATLILTVAAKRTNTRPSSRLKVKPEIEMQTPTTAVISADSLPISLAGYDKPLRSRKETVLVTNNSPHHLLRLLVTIDYRDLQGRQLNERTVWITAPVDPGATHQCVFDSWDVQQSYVYRHSVTPRRQHTPYDVKFTVDSAEIASCYPIDIEPQK